MSRIGIGKIDGGAAFPHVPVSNDREHDIKSYSGMTLRDWFAGMAMQALISRKELISKENLFSPSQISAIAYVHADAMIKERDSD